MLKLLPMDTLNHNQVVMRLELDKRTYLQELERRAFFASEPVKVLFQGQLRLVHEVVMCKPFQYL